MLIVLFSGKVDDLVSTTNLGQLRDLEDELRATGHFTAVLGPVMALDSTDRVFAVDSSGTQLDVGPGVARNQRGA